MPEANDLRTFPAQNLSTVEGRWMSPDPAGLSAVDLGNPQNLNRYAYVVGNPFGLVDPTGMSLSSIVQKFKDFFGTPEEEYQDEAVGGDYLCYPDCVFSVEHDESGSGSPTQASGPSTSSPPKSGTAPNGQAFSCPGDFSYYGNYGGPGWTGGQTVLFEQMSLQQEAAIAPPIDAQDNAYKSHDYCYAKARVANHASPCSPPTGATARAQARCDLNLERDLLSVYPNAHSIGSQLLFIFHGLWNWYGPGNGLATNTYSPYRGWGNVDNH